MDVSVIDALPPGRKPIQTFNHSDNRRASLYAFIRKQIQEGRQVYIVYPLIQESEKMDIKNLEEGYLHICEAFPEYKVSKVHGKMKPAEKDTEMQRFLRNETQIMVATTVIEVGVNVPNASVMVIENAERFGLSQLHQLRGRVGRGADQSYCMLVTGYKLTEDTRKRIEIMVQTNDGFEIAEADLKLRGPGDLEGTQQSGVAFDLKIADIARDGQLLQYVREIAERLLDDDPDGVKPENAVVWQQLKELRKKHVNWAVISWMSGRFWPIGHQACRQNKSERLLQKTLAFIFTLRVKLLFQTVTVTAHELIYTSSCIDQLRFTSVELGRAASDFQLYQRISFAFEFDCVFSSTS